MTRAFVVLAICLAASALKPSTDVSASAPREAAAPTAASASVPSVDDVLMDRHGAMEVTRSTGLQIQLAPACRLGDRPARPSGAGDWMRAVVDTRLTLPATYEPAELVDTGMAGLNAGYEVRSAAVADLRALVRAARQDGARLAVVSGYRSYAEQAGTFAGWAAANGYADALRGSARPGHSEHQLGTALDFRSAGGPAPWTVADWARTPEGAWLSAHAWQFGWVMSYPKGGHGESCYDYEPWHYRYLGRSLAQAIHAAGVAPRVYLWSLASGIS